MISRRSHPWSAPRHRTREPNKPVQATYNIILIDHNLIVDHQSLNFPEVHAVTTALRAVENIRIPIFPWQPHHDLLDWLGAFFGFQVGNVSNQREHLVLLLANAQMRLQPPPENADILDPSILRHFRRKLLCNYTYWCSSVGCESNIWILDSGQELSAAKQRRELLYVALYLLIWGESANLRFIPGFICYVFHHMSVELNKIVENWIDKNTGMVFSPSISGENAFLNRIVTPVYEIVKDELKNSRKETAPHSNWPNYDEIDKYFWSRRFLDKLKWPIDIRSNFFSKRKTWVGKMRFVVPKLHTLYSVYSSIVGIGVGICNNLNEIQNMQQLRLEFQFLASAMQYNLISEEHMFNASGTSKSKFKDAIRRLKLKYGIGRQFKKLELKKVETEKFTLVWNEIILALREEDRVSDHEVEILTMANNDWNVRVIRWPCLFLCNELFLALNQSMEFVDAPDKRLWEEIADNEYRRCAVIEAFDSVKHLLLTIVRSNTREYSILTNFLQEIDNSVNIEMFTKTFNVHALPTIHAKLITLLNILMKPEKDVIKVVNTLRALYEVSTREFFKEKRNMDELLFENAVELPYLYDDNFYHHVGRLHTILTSRNAMNINVPINLEARNRLLFFSNSLFANMPCAPQVKRMMAFSVLTPNNNEVVIYNKEQLRTESEDGVSMLHNLQTIYADEWQNFMERMWREGLPSEDELWTRKLRDLRLWASYRGQTLARTVRGTMYYYRALKLLGFLDFASEIDIGEGSREQMSMRYGGLRCLTRAGSRVSSSSKGHEYISHVQMKFAHVVACEMYGSQKSKKDHQADEILYLMKNNETLRVAYVDEVQGRDGNEYYSVLVKFDQELQEEVEIYRVKLPGPLKLIGEGKNEYLSHAMIFTRGDVVQIVDRKQDNYFEEALKMRNLLEEYGHRRYYDICKKTTMFDRLWFLNRGGICNW